MREFYEAELDDAVEQAKVTALRECDATDLEEIGWTDAARAAATAARKVGGGVRRAVGTVKRTLKKAGRTAGAAFGGPQRKGKEGGVLGIAGQPVRKAPAPGPGQHWRPGMQFPSRAEQTPR